MAKFDFIRERVSIVDDSDSRLELKPQEALDLLRWLSEHRNALFKVLNAPMDLVTERAIELVKELQVEYKVHPLLEEDNTFPQG